MLRVANMLRVAKRKDKERRKARSFTVGKIEVNTVQRPVIYIDHKFGMEHHLIKKVGACCLQHKSVTRPHQCEVYNRPTPLGVGLALRARREAFLKLYT